jgi:hypothetical protein
LFLQTPSGIANIVLDTKKTTVVTNGYLLKPIGLQTILYYKEEALSGRGKFKVVFYKIDMASRTVTRLGDLDNIGFKGADCDPTGRFIVITVPSAGSGFSFDLRTVPLILDTQTGTHYELPSFEKVTGCIFWQEK